MAARPLIPGLPNDLVARYILTKLPWHIRFVTRGISNVWKQELQQMSLPSFVALSRDTLSDRVSGLVLGELRRVEDVALLRILELEEGTMFAVPLPLSEFELPLAVRVVDGMLVSSNQSRAQGLVRVSMLDLRANCGTWEWSEPSSFSGSTRALKIAHKGQAYYAFHGSPLRTEMYHPSTNSWTTVGGDGESACILAGVVSSPTRVIGIFLGSFSGCKYELRQLEDTMSWTRITGGLSERQAHTIAIVNGKILNMAIGMSILNEDTGIWEELSCDSGEEIVTKWGTQGDLEVVDCKGEGPNVIYACTRQGKKEELVYVGQTKAVVLKGEVDWTSRIVHWKKMQEFTLQGNGNIVKFI